MAFDTFNILKITIIILSLIVLVITFIIMYEPEWLKHKKQSGSQSAEQTQLGKGSQQKQ